MRELFLLRHADAAQDDSDDHARPLSARGVVEAAAIAKRLRRVGADVGLVLCSSALRTRETLQSLQDGGALGAGFPGSPNPEILIEEGLYLASARRMLEFLHSVPPETESVLLVGHNPGIHDLATQLAGEGDREAYALLREGMRPAGLCRLEIPSAWADLGPNAARLISYNLPN